jgi:hypothetical protein
VIGVAIVALLFAAAAVVALLAFSSGSDNDDPVADYRAQVTETLKPVDAANLRLSNALSRLDRGRPTQALNAVARATDANSAARGALGAIAVPDGGDDLAAQVRQALDREQTYLNAVDTALARPSDPGASQLPTLAGNLTSAFEAVDAPIAGPDNVSGVEALTAWVQRTRRAASRGRAGGDAASPTRPATPAPESPIARGRDCGSGTHAGPNTTCDFAHLVRQAWTEAPGLAATVDVYSPATGRTHTMHCAPAGNGISCSGGNNASVSW